MNLLKIKFKYLLIYILYRRNPYFNTFCQDIFRLYSLYVSQVWEVPVLTNNNAPTIERDHTLIDLTLETTTTIATYTFDSFGLVNIITNIIDFISPNVGDNNFIDTYIIITPITIFQYLRIFVENNLNSFAFFLLE